MEQCSETKTAGYTTCCFCYLFFSKKSFENSPEWIRQCRDNSEPGVKLILIGNKNDIEE